MTLVITNNKMSQIVGTSFTPPPNKLTLFNVIPKNLYRLCSRKLLIHIEVVHNNYVTMQLYECINETNKTNIGCALSLKTGVDTVCSGNGELVSNQMVENGNEKIV